jgi:hypothetical protein
MGNRTPPRSTKQHDFSGEYVLNRQASKLSAAAAGGVQSASVSIEHQEPHFRCQFTFIVDGKPFEGAFELVTDGREVTHMERGRLTVSTLHWDGDALVSTDRSEGTITFRYELLDAGRRLRVTEQIRGTDHDQDNLWIFERQ